MRRTPCLAALSLAFAAGLLFPSGKTDAVAPPLKGEWERQVAALIDQLANSEFEKREAAQRALSRLGPKVVPLLDRRAGHADPEVRARLARLRRGFVGYDDDIRSWLAALPEVEGEHKPPIPAELAQLIDSHQPRSGDLLLSLLADPASKLRRRATNAFVRSWDGMTADQLDAYFRRALSPEKSLRPRYPQGVDARVGLGYTLAFGYGGWPTDKKPAYATRTTHLLDGRPHGRPFEYHLPFATTGWVGTKDLPLGRHTVALVVEYEITHRGTTRKGSIRSPDYAFEVTGPATPDDLIAPADRETDRGVRAGFRVLEVDDTPVPRFRDGREPDPWVPQITWTSATGKACGLHVPLWRVTKSLPVDLCFEAEIRDVKTGEVFQAESVVLARGQTRWGYVSVKDVHKFARGRSGFVPVVVSLRPSRGLALSSPEVTSYYPGTITSEVVRIKVDGE